MHDALAQARRELGNEMKVLHSRQYEDPVLFGLASRQCVEILAAVDTRKCSIQTLIPEASVPNVSALEDVVQTAPAQAAISYIVERLVRNGVPMAVAEAVVFECKSVEDSSLILDVITRRIPVSGPLDCGHGQARVVLVGPTGVGKTTTAAKLAAQYSYTKKKKVALLTLDTYRIAAVEQLAAYARILEIPLEVALCPEDAAGLIAKHADKDLIIIDTVGRSQRSRDGIDELARFVRAADATEVHLVVSASTSPAAQQEVVDGFAILKPSRMLLTKLDECPQPGCILGLAAASLLPFSYIADGQDVPDDIAEADKRELAGLVWEGTA